MHVYTDSWSWCHLEYSGYKQCILTTHNHIHRYLTPALFCIHFCVPYRIISLHTNRRAVEALSPLMCCTSIVILINPSLALTVTHTQLRMLRLDTPDSVKVQIHFHTLLLQAIIGQYSIHAVIDQYSMHAVIGQYSMHAVIGQ